MNRTYCLFAPFRRLKKSIKKTQSIGSRGREYWREQQKRIAKKAKNNNGGSNEKRIASNVGNIGGLKIGANTFLLS
jgi:hypothetical protein